MEEEYKKLYNALLEQKELKKFFPKMSGKWEKDKTKFIYEQKKLEDFGK